MKPRIYALQAGGKVIKCSFALGITFQVACQQHTHAGRVLHRRTALQEDRLSPCNETPSSIAADIQSVRFLSQHYCKTSRQEGGETVTSSHRLSSFDAAQVFCCTSTWYFPGISRFPWAWNSWQHWTPAIHETTVQWQPFSPVNQYWSCPTKLVRSGKTLSGVNRNTFQFLLSRELFLH